MTGPEGLRIPKIAMAVELAIDSADATLVDVYVAEHQDHAYRRQSLLDLLEGEAQFLSAHDAAADVWAAYNKETIAWVRVPITDGSLPIEESHDSPVDEQLFDVVRDVSVRLSTGESKRGQLLYSPPAGRARVSDYLNSEGRFFRLWTQDHLFLINKRYVLQVVEHDMDSRGESEQ